MTRVPRNVKPQQAIKFLEKFGFLKGKGRGSHVRLTHPDGRWTQVAVHPRPIPEGTLRKIIRQTEVTDGQLKELK
ncbi:MAG: Uncharacterized protein G01um10147_488 [Microgenomates group bacterium Gr01-1014_7]|nr:MAG: Uncharacterized protein G01um10147_488 [Microgenomates group bacterium Gr01-1014_7]